MKHLQSTTIFIIIAFLLSSTTKTFIYSFIIYDRQMEPRNVVLSIIEVSNHSANNEISYRLFTSTNVIEMLVDHNETFQLELEPKLTSNVTKNKLLARFFCEDSETDSFNWNSTNNNCKVLTVEPKFTFTFDTDRNSQNPKYAIIKALKPGKQLLVAHVKWIISDQNNTNISNSENEIKVDTRRAYITLNVGRSDTILLISTIIGWIYFTAWSVSFYPQIWDNFKRKSVIGLNFDFVALNITGFISYSMFNVSLYVFHAVQKEYKNAHPRSQIPVQMNDVVFGLHATFATFICIVQCFLYERGEQTISLFSKIFLGIVWSGYVTLAILVASTNLLNMLNYLYISSYVKLVITIIKYIPQAWYNYQRKSTIGWSIGNIFLDFTGGSLSMCQMFLLAHNYDDWVTIFNNFTKFGLGFISILFDILFLLQHYVFYRYSSEVHDSQSLLIDDKGENGSGCINIK